ncbi:MAG: hypothetical protein O3C21_21290 [Verrucomicrobia bacterium]|nr:hypothetical protein [Verrucomicrobiota bacterium]
MRQILGIILGLVFGAAGAFLFLRSMPPEEGSAADKLEEVQHALARAEMKVKELNAITERDKNEEAKNSARAIADDLKAGRLVDVDDIFKSAKPWMQNFAPVFDRVRVREQQHEFDTVAGEYARKYNLDDRQHAALNDWLDEMAEKNGEKFASLVADESSGLEDFIRASKDFQNPLGLDAYMESMLEGDALAAYQADRMEERVLNVQQEADRKVERLDRMVGLDDAQADEVFNLMARGSADFDPEMRIEGLSGDVSPIAAGKDREEAVMAVLRPDQIATYEQTVGQRRVEAEEDMRALGLRPPENWNIWDEDDF